MQLIPKSAPAELATGRMGLSFLLEPEPWLRIFLRNLADLFRPALPPVWITSPPAEYWPDALVHRPAAWTAIRQSSFGHLLVILLVFEVTQLWVDQPRVISETPRHIIIHYQLSEYLPAVQPFKKRPTPPVRPKAQAADPEYAAQEIISMHVDHTSKRQTIIQPDLNLLHQDVPMPNMMVSTAIPGAPLASRRALENVMDSAPQVVPPAEQALNRSASHLIFPALPQPQVVGPATPVAMNHSGPILPESGPIVVPPSPELARDPSRLQIPAQAPEVAPPASSVATGHMPGQTLLAAVPQVVPPAQQAAGRRGNPGLDLSAPPTVVPPPPPVSSGTVSAQPNAVGQILALNAHPIVPEAPLVVPAGNRQGEFAAGPNGRVGATARPETRAGDNPSDSNPGGETAGSPNVYVSAPPAKVTGNVVMAPAVRVAIPDRTDLPSDKIDAQVFGGRRRYSTKLSMANLNSTMASWTMRFAELHGDPSQPGALSTPDPIKKVDPAYPANMVYDRIEGVVVLYAVIHTDGSVGEVRVLEGFNERLDENARAALEQWRFRPGTKNGVPVDVEAVVRVPFRVPKQAF